MADTAGASRLHSVHTPIGPVELRIPPDPALSRVLRLTASGLASLSGFDLEQIEGIKIAISEVLLALIKHGDGAPIEVKMEADLQAFDIHGRTEVAEFDVEHPDLVLCRTVLAEVGSEHGIDFAGGQARIWSTVTHSKVE